MDVPYLEPDEIRSAARDLRERALGSPPPLPVDLDALVFDYLYEEHGVGFYCDRELGDPEEDDLLGKTLPFKNEIYVDAELADEGHTGRYRFTVAHEIGHWVLHRPLLADDGPDPGGETDGVRFVTFERDVVGGDDTDYRPEEWQANAFAIWLLLPDDPLEREFAERFGERSLTIRADWETPDNAEEPLRGYSRAFAATPKDGCKPLHERFQLSVEATAIALEERGYVTDD